MPTATKNSEPNPFDGEPELKPLFNALTVIKSQQDRRLRASLLRGLSQAASKLAEKWEKDFA